MADTRRDLSALQTLLADNTGKKISAQDLRDFLVSSALKNLVTKTSDYTADADDQTVLLDGTSNAVAITLPTAVGILGKQYVLKCINKDNACTIETNGAETIDGAANYTFGNVNDSILLVSDNTNWYIKASDLIVVTAKIKDANVTHVKLATDAVETDNIKDANITFAKLAEAAIRQIMPVGSVIAWTNHITGTPTLPDGWKLCDGTAISDVDSPMNGETVPDYNGDIAFLRGGATSSNTKQDDAMQGHTHSTDLDWVGSGGSTGPGAGDQINSGITGNPYTDSVNGTPRTASETRPVNMTVKWIMRVR